MFSSLISLQLFPVCCVVFFDVMKKCHASPTPYVASRLWLDCAVIKPASWPWIMKGRNLGSENHFSFQFLVMKTSANSENSLDHDKITEQGIHIPDPLSIHVQT